MAHFLSHDGHLCELPFLCTPTTNNKTYQIEIDYTLITWLWKYQLFFNKSTPTSHNGLLKYKTMDWLIDWNGRK
jgi:hypothetical protein